MFGFDCLIADRVGSERVSCPGDCFVCELHLVEVVCAEGVCCSVGCVYLDNKRRVVVCVDSLGL